MAGSSLSVKVTADISELRAQLALGQQVQRDYNAQVRDLAKQAAAAGEAQRSVLMPALQAAAERAAAAKTEVASLNAELKSMNGGGGSGFSAMRTEIEGLQAPLSAVMGLGQAFMATFAIDKIVGIANSFATFGAQISRAMDQTGMSAEQLSALKLAGEENEMEFTQLTRVMTIFARNISAAREGSQKQALAFNALGISAKDLAEHGNDMGFMFETVAKHLNEFGDGANKSALETAIFGGRVQGLGPILKDVAENGMAGLQKHAEELNVLLNHDTVEAADNAEKAFKDFDAAAAGLENTLGEHLLPALTNVAREFTALFAGSAGSAGILKDELKTTEDQVTAIQSRLASGENMFSRLLDSKMLADDEARITEIKAQLQDIGNQNDKQVKIPDPVAPGKADAPTLPNLSGDVDTMRTQMAQISATWDGTMSGMIAKQQQTVEATRQLMLQQLGDLAKNADGYKEYQAVLQEGDKLQVQARKASQTEAVADAREQVSQINAEANIGAVQRLEQDRAAWQALIDQHKVSGAQLVDVQRQVNQLTAQLQKEQNTESAQIAASQSETDVAISRLTIEAHKANLDTDLQLHRVNAQQKLELLKSLTQQEFELDLQGLNQRLALAANEPVEQARINDQILLLRAKLNEQLAALDRGAAIDAANAAKEQITAWKGAVTQIESAESGLISNLLAGNQKLSQSLLQAAGQLVERELADDAKYLTQRLLLHTTEANSEKALEQSGTVLHALINAVDLGSDETTEAAKTGAAAAGASTRLGIQTSAAAAGKAVQAAADGGSIMDAAATAAANTYSSVSAIPYVGWILAPPAAAAAFAAVVGFKGAMGSAAGGAVVPADNMLFNLHKDEWVLPAGISSGLQNMISGAGGGITARGMPAAQGGGSDGGIIINVQPNISAIDGSSVAAFFNKYGATVAQQIGTQLARNSSLRGKY